MKTVCEFNECAGCMACVDICPAGAISMKEDLSSFNAVIDDKKCLDCKLCYGVCQNNEEMQLLSPQVWYQGWTNDDNLRGRCASGGFASAVSKAFIENGGTVCSCSYSNGRFMFKFAENISELKEFAGSKYVKSNPSGIYKEINEKLKNGNQVLFIGLPCQVAAVKKVAGKRYDDLLYTVDLICHGTPSVKLLDMYLEQYGLSLSNIKNIKFRVGQKYQILADNKTVITKNVTDKYLIAFLNALTYTDNCYSCRYARKERVSDLTLGDSWGSELDDNQKNNGISLALCQTEKGIELLQNSDVSLKEVNIEKAILSNKQLRQPSRAPAARQKFFEGIKNGKNFNRNVFSALPKQSIRQDVKKFLIKSGIAKIIGRD